MLRDLLPFTPAQPESPPPKYSPDILRYKSRAGECTPIPLEDTMSSISDNETSINNSNFVEQLPPSLSFDISQTHEEEVPMLMEEDVKKPSNPNNYLQKYANELFNIVQDDPSLIEDVDGKRQVIPPLRYWRGETVRVFAKKKANASWAAAGLIKKRPKKKAASKQVVEEDFTLNEYDDLISEENNPIPETIKENPPLVIQNSAIEDVTIPSYETMIVCIPKSVENDDEDHAQARPMKKAQASLKRREAEHKDGIKKIIKGRFTATASSKNDEKPNNDTTMDATESVVDVLNIEAEQTQGKPKAKRKAKAKGANGSGTNQQSRPPPPPPYLNSSMYNDPPSYHSEMNLPPKYDLDDSIDAITGGARAKRKAKAKAVPTSKSLAAALEISLPTTDTATTSLVLMPSSSENAQQQQQQVEEPSLVDMIRERRKRNTQRNVFENMMNYNVSNVQYLLEGPPPPPLQKLSSSKNSGKSTHLAIENESSPPIAVNSKTKSNGRKKKSNSDTLALVEEDVHLSSEVDDIAPKKRKRLVQESKALSSSSTTTIQQHSKRNKTVASNDIEDDTTTFDEKENINYDPSKTPRPLPSQHASRSYRYEDDDDDDDFDEEIVNKQNIPETKSNKSKSKSTKTTVHGTTPSKPSRANKSKFNNEHDSTSSPAPRNNSSPSSPSNSEVRQFLINHNLSGTYEIKGALGSPPLQINMGQLYFSKMKDSRNGGLSNHSLSATYVKRVNVDGQEVYDDNLFGTCCFIPPNDLIRTEPTPNHYTFIECMSSQVVKNKSNFIVTIIRKGRELEKKSLKSGNTVQLKPGDKCDLNNTSMTEPVLCHMWLISKNSYQGKSHI